MRLVSFSPRFLRMSLYYNSRPRSTNSRKLQVGSKLVSCTQYLRRRVFPEHPDLKLAGLLNPLDAPHHMRQHEQSPFREGVTLDKPPGTRPGGKGSGSFTDVGLKHPVLIDHALKPGVRVTVKMDSYDRKGRKCKHSRSFPLV